MANNNTIVDASTVYKCVFNSNPTSLMVKMPFKDRFGPYGMKIEGTLQHGYSIKTNNPQEFLEEIITDYYCEKHRDVYISQLSSNPWNHIYFREFDASNAIVCGKSIAQELYKCN